MTSKGNGLVLLTWAGLGELEIEMLGSLLVGKTMTWHPRTTVKINWEHPPSSKTKIRRSGRRYLDASYDDVEEITRIVSHTFRIARMEAIRRKLVRLKQPAVGQLGSAGTLYSTSLTELRTVLTKLEKMICITQQQLSSIGGQLLLMTDLFSAMRPADGPEFQHKIDLVLASHGDYCRLTRELWSELHGVGRTEQSAKAGPPRRATKKGKRSCGE